MFKPLNSLFVGDPCRHAYLCGAPGHLFVYDPPKDAGGTGGSHALPLPAQRHDAGPAHHQRLRLPRARPYRFNANPRQYASPSSVPRPPSAVISSRTRTRSSSATGSTCGPPSKSSMSGSGAERRARASPRPTTSMSCAKRCCRSNPTCSSITRRQPVPAEHHDAGGGAKPVSRMLLAPDEAAPARPPPPAAPANGNGGAAAGGRGNAAGPELARAVRSKPCRRIRAGAPGACAVRRARDARGRRRMAQARLHAAWPRPASTNAIPTWAPRSADQPPDDPGRSRRHAQRRAAIGAELVLASFSGW